MEHIPFHRTSFNHQWAGSFFFLLKWKLAMFQLLSKRLLTLSFYLLKGQQSFTLHKRLDIKSYETLHCASLCIILGGQKVLWEQTCHKRNIKIKLQHFGVKISWVQTKLVLLNTTVLENRCKAAWRSIL